ncbi:MAG: MDR family MFS transporter [Bifidobacteriaceae bacterium]|nr:MDR family MFS transporter [Bifidobacteriaceae bacterium]
MVNRCKSLSQPLTKENSYTNNHVSKPAFYSLAILTFITFIGNFTQLQLSAALPTIVQDFGISITTGQWVTSIFQLVMGIMVPLTAFLTRRFTTRQIIITSMIIFTLGSVFAWLGTNFTFLLLGRLLEAIGTGVMWPVLQITVFWIFPMARRGMAMGTVGMAMSVAPAIGPTIGGWQTDANGWRSIFLTLSVLGLFSILLATFNLHNFGKQDTTIRADLFSAVLSVLGFGGLMLAFSNLETYQLTHPMIWVPLIVGIISIIWFVLRQNKRTREFEETRSQYLEEKAKQEQAYEHSKTPFKYQENKKLNQFKNTNKAPLLNLSVLKNKQFAIGTICASLNFFAFSSIMIILPLYIQNDRGFSSTMSGLIILPGALGQCLAQFVGGKMLDRFGARPVALIGSITLTFGTIMMSTINLHTWIWWISIWQFTRQIGVGFVLMPITTWSLNCLSAREVSAGSAVTNTARQIAGAMGAPIMVLIMQGFAAAKHASLGNTANTAIPAHIYGVQTALHISTIICLIMVLLIFFGVRGKNSGSARETAHEALLYFHNNHPHLPHLSSNLSLTRKR